jgi:hypothetical protein
MQLSRRQIVLANIAANLLAALAIDLGSSVALRGPAAAMIVFGTGIAIVPLLRIGDAALNITLVLLTSISALICVTQLVTFTQGFTWRPCERYLLIVTAVGSAAGFLSTRAEAPGR